MCMVGKIHLPSSQEGDPQGFGDFPKGKGDISRSHPGEKELKTDVLLLLDTGAIQGFGGGKWEFLAGSPLLPLSKF